ncbi:MAG: type II toxin-antitoxin system RelE/ParE family toxin [Gammaproteobacteria bacterium]|nr:type II toxin-antitoxin system RelE/ParE family toxin [Gammaproteobacteria bacterium]
MQTVAETPTFTRQASKLFTEDEKRELIDLLATNPIAGDVMPGTGGVRKLRFRIAGSGKRGGGRVIYYFLDEEAPVYALLAYAKAAQTDLTSDERRSVATLTTTLKAEILRRRKP